MNVEVVIPLEGRKWYRSLVKRYPFMVDKMPEQAFLSVENDGSVYVCLDSISNHKIMSLASASAASWEGVNRAIIVMLAAVLARNFTHISIERITGMILEGGEYV